MVNDGCVSHDFYLEQGSFGVILATIPEIPLKGLQNHVIKSKTVKLANLHPIMLRFDVILSN